MVLSVPRTGGHIRRAFLVLLVIALFVVIQVQLVSRHIFWPGVTYYSRNVTLISLQNSSNGIFSRSSSSEVDQPFCFRPNFTEPTKLVINTTLPTEEEVKRMFPHIQPGGHWQPTQCRARQHVGIFIPLRNRWEHLHILTRHLHQLLVRQWRHYTIYVIEQADEAPFNRGKLLNAGVAEAVKLEPDLNCFILHDVDTLPESAYAIYKCHENDQYAFQMATFQKKRNYHTAYKGYTGGVVAIRRTQYEDINGFSNDFWGWGGEDDDLNNRLEYMGYEVLRDFTRGAYYYSLDHPEAKANPKREEIIRNHTKLEDVVGEGLSTVQYALLKSERLPLYTLFSVNISLTSPSVRTAMDPATDQDAKP